MKSIIKTIVYGVVLLPAFALTSCDQKSEQTAPVAEPEMNVNIPKPEYVGGQACQACHAEQFQAWTDSHHDLAMQPANTQTVLGDFNQWSTGYASNGGPCPPYA